MNYKKILQIFLLSSISALCFAQSAPMTLTPMVLTIISDNIPKLELGNESSIPSSSTDVLKLPQSLAAGNSTVIGSLTYNQDDFIEYHFSYLDENGYGCNFIISHSSSAPFAAQAWGSTNYTCDMKYNLTEGIIGIWYKKNS